MVVILEHYVEERLAGGCYARHPLGKVSVELASFNLQPRLKITVGHCVAFKGQEMQKN